MNPVGRMDTDLVFIGASVEPIATYAATNPDRAWMRSGGWSLTAFPRGEPGREVLDRIVPDRKAADLVLLDRNLRAPDAGPVGEARVLATYVEGERVYTPQLTATPCADSRPTANGEASAA